MGIAKLPNFLKKYFWDVDFKTLDSKGYPYYVIKRVLNYGDERSTRWLFRNYDKEIIQETLQKYRGFTKRAATYWAKFFNMPRREIMYFKKGFPNPPVRLWPY